MLSILVGELYLAIINFKVNMMKHYNSLHAFLNLVENLKIYLNLMLNYD